MPRHGSYNSFVSLIRTTKTRTSPLAYQCVKRPFFVRCAAAKRIEHAVGTRGRPARRELGVVPCRFEPARTAWNDAERCGRGAENVNSGD